MLCDLEAQRVMGWLEIKQTFNSNRMKKELKKQTKLMEKSARMLAKPQSLDHEAYEAGYFKGWEDCNTAWWFRGHHPEGGCRK